MAAYPPPTDEDLTSVARLLKEAETAAMDIWTLLQLLYAAMPDDAADLGFCPRYIVGMAQDMAEKLTHSLDHAEGNMLRSFCNV
ncbi:hypothetical protein GCM10009097_05180 [Pigmentiphaga daeguensis]|uniref:Uncharacterized protein n=2 Tax=Pigmentiphaga daeguensis TaxID=414049 RepID=A0ABN1BA91_9BURK